MHDNHIDYTMALVIEQSLRKEPCLQAWIPFIDREYGLPRLIHERINVYLERDYKSGLDVYTYIKKELFWRAIYHYIEETILPGLIHQATANKLNAREVEDVVIYLIECKEVVDIDESTNVLAYNDVAQCFNDWNKATSFTDKMMLLLSQADFWNETVDFFDTDEDSTSFKDKLREVRDYYTGNSRKRMRTS